MGMSNLENFYENHVTFLFLNLHCFWHLGGTLSLVRSVQTPVHI